MNDSRIEKMISIAKLMDKYNFEKNEILNRRISNYDFQANTTITHKDKQIKISTETNIKGVHNVLFLFSNGMSKVDFEFD